MPANEVSEESIKAVIASMSLKEKVQEMHGSGIIRMGLSIILFKKLIPVKAGGNKKFAIPPTIFLDGPRGVSLYKGATAFPVTMARGASWDRDLEKRIGEAMAKEIRALGANYSGAVCMNLLRHPKWGRAQETYGEDPFHVGEMAVALTDGIQKHNVQACAKHFAANSMENNRFGGSMNMRARTLHEVYLPHFKKVVQFGVASIMSAYNKLNRIYCGHHKMLLSEILRKDWGFEGYVTSDWNEGLFDTVEGMDAGMNIEMPIGRYYSYKKIKKLIKEEKISEQQIDELIHPIIRTKLLFASKEDQQTYSKDLVGCIEHQQLALEAAEKSAVLLKNEILPIDKNKIKRIAVIGSLASVKQTGDRGSSNVFASYIVSPIEGIRNYLNDTTIEILTAPVDDLQKIKAASEKADVVLVVAGTTYKDEGEYIGTGFGNLRDKNDPDKEGFVTKLGFLALGGDRKQLNLHQEDIEIIQTAATVNKNVIVNLVAGSAIMVEEWHENVSAILQTFYNGMEGGNALAKILFGDVNPSGKLPFTVAQKEEDLPPFDSFEPQVNYGYYHGYTLFDKERKSSRFPFGFGLNYTSFKISDLQISSSMVREEDELHVSVLVKNIGNRAGAEVVQLYISFEHSTIDRPLKLLRGFEKVYLLPNEEKQIKLNMPVKDLAYYDEVSNDWKIEKMKYAVMIGNSSDDKNMLRATFEVQ